MSCDLQDILELSKDALSCHCQGSLEECVAKLGSIREKLMHIDRSKLDSAVIWNISSIVNGERGKWTEDIKPSVDSFEVASQALFCMRNMFVNCSQIQLVVAETVDLRDVLLECLKWVFITNEGKLDSKPAKENESKDKSWEEKLSQLAVATITCFGNLVAANTTTRKIMWPLLLPHVRHLLRYRYQHVSYLSSMVIFNCVLEQELEEALCRSDDINDVISDLLTLYLESESSSEKALCFVMFTLEILLCHDGMVKSVWCCLSASQQLLMLDIISNILEGKSGAKCGPLSPSAVSFLLDVFKNEADKILRTLTTQLGNDHALVVVRLLNFVCLLAASEYWSPTLREDVSLLVTAVSLLQCMNDIGSVETNGFSRLGLDDISDEEKVVEAENHPAYGFKRDLIRLIANLVYRHKINQDKVREMNGITLILESSQFDARNPAIKEVSVYAIRNLLEGNLENQQLVKELEYRGSAENQAMQITRENGMVFVHGSSSTKDEQH